MTEILLSVFKGDSSTQKFRVQSISLVHLTLWPVDNDSMSIRRHYFRLPPGNTYVRMVFADIDQISLTSQYVSHRMGLNIINVIHASSYTLYLIDI